MKKNTAQNNATAIRYCQKRVTDNIPERKKKRIKL